MQPLVGFVPCSRLRCKPEQRLPLQEALIEALQRLPAFGKRTAYESGAAFVDQQIEDHVQRRMLPSELVDAALRGVDAHEQFIERQRVAFGYDELSIEYERPCRQRFQRCDDFGEIAIERLPGLRPQIYRVRVPESEAAETVELRFISPFITNRELRHELRFHRRVRGRYGQRHRFTENGA